MHRNDASMSLPAQWMVFTNQNANTGLPELCIFFQQINFVLFLANYVPKILNYGWIIITQILYLIYLSVQIFSGFTFNTKLLSIFKVATPERGLFCLQINWSRELWLDNIYISSNHVPYRKKLICDI